MKLTKSYLPFILAGAAGAIVASLIPLLISPTKADTKLLPFQGRLTDANGSAIPDGAKVVEFKMYDAPTGGNLKNWAGEVHKLSVNGGLVNTMLGTKASLGSVDFSTPTYLQITIDAQETGPGHDIIDPADPPLLPRQSVVPAVYAIEAGNSRTLKGGDGSNYDWSALFGTQNPATGTFSINRVAIEVGGIAADRISADNKLTAEQLADNSVEAGELANDSVDSSAIKDGEVKTDDLNGTNAGDTEPIPGAVTSEKIKDGTIQSRDISRGSVTQAKLATRETGVRVGVGGFATSAASSVGFVTTATSVWQDVPALDVSVDSTGRPVFIGLVHDGIAGKTGIFGADGATCGARIRIMRNITEVLAEYGTSSQGVSYIGVPASSCWTIKSLPEGTHRFTIMLVLDNGTRAYVSNAKLVAYEL